MRPIRIAVCIIWIFFTACASASKFNNLPDNFQSPLFRHYREGETFAYVISGRHWTDGVLNWEYRAELVSKVIKDSHGIFYEEINWGGIRKNGIFSPSSPASLKFRQELSLDPRFASVPHQLAQLPQAMVGPVTDLLSFYVDAQLAIRQTSIKRPGDHIHINYGKPSAWPTGQDCIDFEINYLDSETLEVKHVPPHLDCLQFPGSWMNESFFDLPNNWYQIERNDEKFTAQVGKETFTSKITFDSTSSRILRASMENPVEFWSRSCDDAKLISCNSPKKHRIFRQIELSLKE